MAGEDMLMTMTGGRGLGWKIDLITPTRRPTVILTITRMCPELIKLKKREKERCRKIMLIVSSVSNKVQIDASQTARQEPRSRGKSKQ